MVTAFSAKPLIIGEGSFLAAEAVVTKDVPPYTLLGVVPAILLFKITTPATQNTNWK